MMAAASAAGRCAWASGDAPMADGEDEGGLQGGLDDEGAGGDELVAGGGDDSGGNRGTLDGGDGDGAGLGNELLAEATRVEPSVGGPLEAAGVKKKKKRSKSSGHKNAKGTGVRQYEARKRAYEGAKEPAVA